MALDAAAAGGAEHSSEELETVRLVARAQEGDGDALAAIYRRYFDRVYAYLQVALRERHDAEHVTHEVFAQVFRSLPAYDVRDRPFRFWLFRIARKQLVDYQRALGRVPAADPVEVDRDRELDLTEELPALAWTNDRDMVLLVERLPDAQRQALALRYVIGFTTTEIAELLGRKPESVAELHSGAVRFLHRRLAAAGREPSESAARTRRLNMRGRGRAGSIRPLYGFSLAR